MISIRDMMQGEPVIIEPDAPLLRASRLMHDRNINSLVVCDGDRAIQGILTSRDLVRHAATGRSLADARVVEFMTADPATIEADGSFDDAMALMDRIGVRHLPVTEDRRLVGILSVRDLVQHRTRFLEELVGRKTAELEREHAELQKRDTEMQYHLQLASRIQQQLLPAQMPHVPPLSVSVLNRPLQGVSGDSYEFEESVPRQLGVWIADARGHGVPAAFVSVMARMVFQAYGHQAISPSAMLRTMNERLPHLIQADHFITMCYAEIDAASLQLTYATAGHPPPFWHRAEAGTVELLEARGDLIGVLPNPTFEQKTIQLAPGDTVLFYTDGIIEARREDNEQFGEQRVADLLGRANGDDVLSTLERSLETFCGDLALGDDITGVALRVTPDASAG